MEQLSEAGIGGIALRSRHRSVEQLSEAGIGGTALRSRHRWNSSQKQSLVGLFGAILWVKLCVRSDAFVSHALLLKSAIANRTGAPF